jgi:hypothetical protein
MSYFRDNNHQWAVWHDLLRGRESRFRRSRFPTPEGFWDHWQDELESRVDEATRALSDLPGVVGLILGGGIGKGVPWPLSDIDIIGVYDETAFEQTKEAVRDVRTRIERDWVHEGFVTGLDIKGIVFGDREVERFIRTDIAEVEPFLDDRRWYHGLDKAANGRVVYGTGVSEALLEKITRVRYGSEELRQRRLARWALPTPEEITEARITILEGNLPEANRALRTLVGGYVGHLFGGQWDDSGKLGRNCTRFERAADERKVGDVCRRLMRLCEDPARSSLRLKRAPHRVLDQHRLSFPSRKLIGEDITAEEDARDVLDFFTNLHRSHGPDTTPAWSGLNASRGNLQRRLDRLREVLCVLVDVRLLDASVVPDGSGTVA